MMEHDNQSEEQEEQAEERQSHVGRKSNCLTVFLLSLALATNIMAFGGYMHMRKHYINAQENLASAYTSLIKEGRENTNLLKENTRIMKDAIACQKELGDTLRESISANKNLGTCLQENYSLNEEMGYVISENEELYLHNSILAEASFRMGTELSDKNEELDSLKQIYKNTVAELMMAYARSSGDSALDKSELESMISHVGCEGNIRDANVSLIEIAISENATDCHIEIVGGDAFSTLMPRIDVIVPIEKAIIYNDARRAGSAEQNPPGLELPEIELQNKGSDI